MKIKGGFDGPLHVNLCPIKRGVNICFFFNMEKFTKMKLRILSKRHLLGDSLIFSFDCEGQKLPHPRVISYVAFFYCQYGHLKICFRQLDLFEMNLIS